MYYSRFIGFYRSEEHLILVSPSVTDQCLQTMKVSERVISTITSTKRKIWTNVQKNIFCHRNVFNSITVLIIFNRQWKHGMYTFLFYSPVQLAFFRMRAEMESEFFRSNVASPYPQVWRFRGASHLTWFFPSLIAGQSTVDSAQFKCALSHNWDKFTGTVDFFRLYK